MEKTIEDLKNIGFVYVGNWKINQDNKIYFDINAEYLNENHLLYAFEVNSIVKYIGITENTFGNRMTLYKSGHNEKSSGSTNKNVHNQIKELLESKKSVNIYLLKADAPCNFKGYEISLATGIEKSLIKAFDFEQNLWNKRGSKKGKQEKKTKNKGNTQQIVINEANCINGCYIKKTATNSHLKGKINFGNLAIESLPNYDDAVTIHLGEEVFQANFINANKRGGNNPMINSVVTGNWLEQNGIRVGNTFYIKICNRNTFYFYVNDVK